MWLKSRLCVFISIHGHRHAHLFLNVLFFLVFLYFVLKSFFHLFLNPAMVPDENSHGRSLVQLQLREHGQPGLCHTRQILCHDESCSLRASACARVKLLRGFWDRGRVCGDRSVLVTSHRPAHSSRAHVLSLDRILHFACEVFFLFAHLPPRCTFMSVDLELAKILDEFAVPEAFRTKLLGSACLKVWQFAEYVDDVKDWTGILSSLEPPIVDRMHIASVRRAYKAACARDAELLSRSRDYPGEDMDAPIESNRRRTLIEEHARHYRFQLQLSRQPSDTLLGRLDREKNRGTFTVINLAKVASVAT